MYDRERYTRLYWVVRVVVQTTPFSLSFLVSAGEDRFLSLTFTVYGEDECRTTGLELAELVYWSRSMFPPILDVITKIYRFTG